MIVIIYATLFVLAVIAYLLGSAIYSVLVKKKDYLFEAHIGRYIFHFSMEIIVEEPGTVHTRLFIGRFKM